MSDSPSSNLADSFYNLYQQLQSELIKQLQSELQTENVLSQLYNALQLDLKITTRCQEILQKHSPTNSQEELVGLLQLISLLEEKTREQDSTIAHLQQRIEKLEEDNLQTRIEAAKHHLDSMEKLAILQQKVNSR